MTTEKTQDEKYTQDGITFKSKEDWEKYTSDSKAFIEKTQEVAEKAKADADRAVTAALEADNIILTTENNPQDFFVEERIEIITAECVLGMNIFRDFFAGITDFFGGRSEASQKVLRDARKLCILELKKEAYRVGGNAIIGIDLDYSEISGKGKGMLFLVASGTAVKVEKSN